MKLLRFGAPGAEKPGLLDADGVIRDLSGVVPDLAGDVLSPEGLARLAAVNTEELPMVSPTMRLGPPVGGTRNFVAIGLNYADHAAESGAAVPKEPIVFLKSLNSLAGPDDDVAIPPDSRKTDWEVELAIIIGTLARRVSPEAALEHVAGYAICNDVSEREWQMERGGTWDKGKSADGYGPVGPWLVTADEVPDPQDLGMWLEVDGRRMQDGSTRTMIFDVRTIVSYVSQFITLHPGDIITTGTPPGVAMGMKPPAYLRPGQVMRLGIDGLGVQTQKTVAAE
ncbi:fumarylacetoacetate hydrolase family protein [Roseomonas sp. SSH11]|uniref:Fumarylacetoacetate hydrolase family protein n=1 Tax=Pararoseomonas baculiformis TaxID=2820812 RepID=A0ABS4A969_9PROT|nr:fumarylacetoacetate hydrolase family protein [Pararoseomonas baculiformis]MBP0443540.1 fumarylacetoacetate hydrolase family protein [Pararoseomonas baculiformis]